MKKIFDRKTELIKRDPLFSELYKSFKIITSPNYPKGDMQEFWRRQITPVFKNTILKEIEEFEGIIDYGYTYPYPELQWSSYSEDTGGLILKKLKELKKKHKEKYPEYWRFFELRGKVSYKWNILLDFKTEEISFSPITSVLNRTLPFKRRFNEEMLWVGSAPDYFSKFPRLVWSPYPNSLRIQPILADINMFVNPSLKTGEKWIPIVVNTSRIKQDDFKVIKKYFIEIIKAHYEKGKSRRPYNEHPELEFLYRIRREETFQNYLRWYDIHTKEKLSFRLIALIDKTDKTNPQKASEILERLKQKKIKWGKSIKGEDKIEKGVKPIYKAIHRTDYSQKKAEPLIEIDKLICPIHKNEECPINCSHLKKWINNFNRIYPVN